jgi:hypothetical protein
VEDDRVTPTSDLAEGFASVTNAGTYRLVSLCVESPMRSGPTSTVADVLHYALSRLCAEPLCAGLEPLICLPSFPALANNLDPKHLAAANWITVAKLAAAEASGDGAQIAIAVNERRPQFSHRPQ